jgi:hypothetical protein
MVRHYLLVISILLLSCVNSTSQRSHDIIPRESFKSILIDIENAQIDFKLDTFTINTTDSVFLESILINYKYSQQQYNKTLLFYINKPEEMLSMLHEIKDSLSVD